MRCTSTLVVYTIHTAHSHRADVMHAYLACAEKHVCHGAGAGLPSSDWQGSEAAVFGVYSNRAVLMHANFASAEKRVCHGVGAGLPSSDRQGSEAAVFGEDGRQARHPASLCGWRIKCHWSVP